MEYTISKENFLNWYFEVDTDETRRIKEDLIDKIISQLYNIGQAYTSVQELFDDCNTEAIKVCYIDVFDVEGEDREFSDLEGDNTIKLR